MLARWRTQKFSSTHGALGPAALRRDHRQNRAPTQSAGGRSGLPGGRAAAARDGGRAAGMPSFGRNVPER